MERSPPFFRTVYSNRNHVTTHPEACFSTLSCLRSLQQSSSSIRHSNCHLTAIPNKVKVCYLSLSDGPQLSPTSHFILSMRVIRNKRQGPVCRNKLVLLYLCNLLLAESYAPEPNPGPRTIKFPCGICSKACKWSTPCVCCHSCDIWYHQECMGMPDAVFKGLKGVNWECVQCRLPNFSTCIFDSTLETSNSFTILSDTTHTDSEISFSCPAATLSPHHTRQPSTNDSCPVRRCDLPMRILVVNYQSIKSPGKKALLQNMIESTQADIVIGTES